MPKEIKLSKGLVAIVDDEDFEWLSQFKWYAVKKKKKSYTYYAARTEWVKGQNRSIHPTMHREILGIKDSNVLVDHINRNGLDNTRNNLRICNFSENNKNRLARGASNYLGVSKIKSGWRATIGVDKKQLFLGSFKTEAEAANCYNLAAIKHHGEFANLNVIKS